MSNSRPKSNLPLTGIPEDRPLRTAGLAPSLPTISESLVIPAPRTTYSTSLRASIAAAKSTSVAQNNSDDSDSDFDATAYASAVFPQPSAPLFFRTPGAKEVETRPNFFHVTTSTFDKEKLLAIGRGHKITDSQSEADGYESCDESDSSHSSQSVIKKSHR